MCNWFVFQYNIFFKWNKDSRFAKCSDLLHKNILVKFEVFIKNLWHIYAQLLICFNEEKMHKQRNIDNIEIMHNQQNIDNIEIM